MRGGDDCHLAKKYFEESRRLMDHIKGKCKDVASKDIVQGVRGQKI